MPRRPLYITAEGRYDLAAIMRAAHALYRRLRPNFPQATLAGQMRAIWSDARREMRDALVGRIAGRNAMLAACISLMPTPTMRQHAADLGV